MKPAHTEIPLSLYQQLQKLQTNNNNNTYVIFAMNNFFDYEFS